MLFIAIEEECHWDPIVWRQEGLISQASAKEEGKEWNIVVMESAME